MVCVVLVVNNVRYKGLTAVPLFGDDDYDDDDDAGDNYVPPTVLNIKMISSEKIIVSVPTRKQDQSSL